MHELVIPNYQLGRNLNKLSFLAMEIMAIAIIHGHRKGLPHIPHTSAHHVDYQVR